MKNIFKIGNKMIGDEELFFVIEEGQANQGNFQKALKMIDAVKEAGADAVEFQLWKADDFYVKNHDLYAGYKQRELDLAQMKDLITYSKEKELLFIATSFSHKIVEQLAKAGCDAFNVNASDLTNPDMLDAVKDTGKPFFLSLLMARVDEINWAVERITQKGVTQFGLLHGQHTMASDDKLAKNIEHTTLGVIETLARDYQRPAGFIDHTPFDWMPATAVAAGARIITKHLALSRAEKGPDWFICLEPQEMKEAIQWAREMNKSIKGVLKTLAPGEDKDRSILRRSIVAGKGLSKGHILERNDLLFKRPGTGLPPSSYAELIGKELKVDKKFDDQILITDVKE